MIKIQRLKEPKKGKSGEEVKPGEMLEFKGIVLKNNNKFSVYVSYWKRPGMDLINRKKRSKEINKGEKNNVKAGKQNSATGRQRR